MVNFSCPLNTDLRWLVSFEKWVKGLFWQPCSLVPFRVSARRPCQSVKSQYQAGSQSLRDQTENNSFPFDLGQ